MVKALEEKEDYYSWAAIQKRIQARIKRPLRVPLSSRPLIDRIREEVDRLTDIPERER